MVLQVSKTSNLSTLDTAKQAVRLGVKIERLIIVKGGITL